MHRGNRRDRANRHMLAAVLRGISRLEATWQLRTHPKTGCSLVEAVSRCLDNAAGRRIYRFSDRFLLFFAEVGGGWDRLHGGVRTLPKQG